MKRLNKVFASLIFSLILLLFTPKMVSADDPFMYKRVYIPILCNSNNMWAKALNNNRQVVGDYTCPDYSGHAYIFQNGQTSELPPLPGSIYPFARVWDINNNGIVVGDSVVNGWGHATMWTNGVPEDLGTLGGGWSIAYGINDSGQVVGVSSIDNGNFYQHPFLWENGTMRDLGTLGNINNTWSGALSINNSGQITGYGYYNNSDHPVLWDQNQITDLGTLSMYPSHAFSINDQGKIVGEYATDPSYGLHTQAFLWQNGSMSELFNGRGIAINNNGLVLGLYYGDNLDKYDLVFWQDGSIVADLTTLTNAQSIGPGYNDLNDNGDFIAGMTLFERVFPNTPVGSNINVSPTNGVNITFSDVTSGGNTTVIKNPSTPEPPSGYSVGDSPYYVVTTTAVYSGNINICFSYDPNQYANINLLSLLHYDNGAWTDITTSNDTTNHVICGTTTSLSPFVVAGKLYNFIGFNSPISNNTVNKAKSGQAIPIKWSLKDINGNYITDLGSATSYGYAQMSSCDGTTSDVTEYVDAGNSSLRYDSLSNQFILNSKTDSSWPGTCQVFTLKLNDGSMHQAIFQFVK